MKIRYFRETDTLWIELRSATAAETRDVDDDTLVEVDGDGSILAITLEHASKRTDVSSVQYEHGGD